MYSIFENQAETIRFPSEYIGFKHRPTNVGGFLML